MVWKKKREKRYSIEISFFGRTEKTSSIVTHISRVQSLYGPYTFHLIQISPRRALLRKSQHGIFLYIEVSEPLSMLKGGRHLSLYLQ